MGLYALGLVFIGKLGLAAVFSVVSAAAAGVSLSPALLGLFGTRIDRLRVRGTVAEIGTSTDGWHRYAAAIGRHPWAYFSAGLITLAVVATPVVFLQTCHVGDGTGPTTYTSRRAFDELVSAFGPGFNGPFTIVVARADPTAPLLRALGSSRDHGFVTGDTASQFQFDQLIPQRIPLIIAVVVILAFLLIMTVFRSLFLALKAALLNLLSIGAAYGVLVAVFQWGWGRALVGVRENVPIEAYVPMVLFAVDFGLSMDYDIFLLSRVKEHWDLTHNNHEAVAEGLSRTARVISGAAIMISVFLSFVPSDLVAIKQLAVGLAASVAIDATLIRLLLVPATMYLFGTSNWWPPSWLDKILPRIALE